MRVANMTRIEIPLSGSFTALRPRSRPAPSNSQVVSQDFMPPPTMPDLYAGLMIGNRYSLTERLARTYFSNVWKAADLLTGSEVAIKFSAGQHIPILQNEEGIINEEIHPMFPRALDSGEHEEAYYLVMNIIPGITLKALIDREERIPIYKAIEICTQVFYGLEALHQKNKVHRDIKPGNVMTNLEEVWLLDFGLTCDIGARQVNGRGVGTPMYIAPEQALNKKAQPAADFYSAGMMLYEMLTKENPMVGANATETSTNQVNKKMPPLPPEAVTERFDTNGDAGIRENVERLHYQLKLIISMMTEKDPESRLADADELIFHLENLQESARELFQYEKLL